MNAIEFLMKDHDTVKALLATANTYDEMKAAFAEICPILQSHTYLEERFFYPRFENHEQIRQLIQEAREQHDLVKQLLDGMKHQNGQEFEKKFQTLRAEVQLHINFGKKGDFSSGPESDRRSNSGRLGDELETAKAACEKGSETAIPVSPR